jgi:hypothetical protein
MSLSDAFVIGRHALTIHKPVTKLRLIATAAMLVGVSVQTEQRAVCHKRFSGMLVVPMRTGQAFDPEEITILCQVICSAWIF